MAKWIEEQLKPLVHYFNNSMKVNFVEDPNSQLQIQDIQQISHTLIKKFKCSSVDV